MFCNSAGKFNIPNLKHKTENDTYLFTFLKYFTFIIVFVSFSLISSLVLHELGHVLYAKYQGCAYKTIFFDSENYAYTEVFCKEDILKFYALLAGPIFPLAICLFIYIFGNRIIRDMSLLIIGFNLLASTKDFNEIGWSQNIILSATFFGFTLLILGVIFMSRAKFDEHFYVHH